MVAAHHIMAYGALCQRVGAMRALAIEAQVRKKKGAAARYWKAYYDTDKEKEQCLQQVLKGLGLSTRKASAR